MSDEAEDEDDTVIAPLTDEDDSTVASQRVRATSDDTVIKHPLSTDDDGTLVSSRRATARDDDETIARRTQREDRTRKVARVPKPAAQLESVAAPGILSAGRVASIPGTGVDRYGVRSPAADREDERRSPVTAPVVPARQNQDAITIDSRTSRTRRRQGTGVLIAVLAVTFGAVVLVVATIAALAVL